VHEEQNALVDERIIRAYIWPTSAVELAHSSCCNGQVVKRIKPMKLRRKTNCDAFPFGLQSDFWPELPVTLNQ